MSKQITPEKRREIAAQVAVHEQYLYQCLTGRRDMNPIEARRVEMETNGEVTRQMLCQKTWQGIWPELTQSIPNSITDHLMTEAAQAGLIERRSVIRRAEDRAMRKALKAGKGVA